jgi:hypothetical protein
MIQSRQTRWIVINRHKINSIVYLIGKNYDQCNYVEKLKVMNYYQGFYSRIYKKLSIQLAKSMIFEGNIYKTRKREFVNFRMSFVEIVNKLLNSKIRSDARIEKYPTFLGRVINKNHATILHYFKNYEIYKNYEDFKYVYSWTKKMIEIESSNDEKPSF